jgi:hypothetical protein
MADLFKEVIPSILETKKDLMRDETDEREYNPFIINRALSYHIDCILYANQMNISHGLDKKLQYSYLLNSIRPMKRKFQPWVKPQKEAEELEYVKECYGYSDQKAKDVLRILSDEQISAIKEKLQKGGVTRK